MINRIDLSLFKCFELLRLPLQQLTLLAGTNASGKSTVMQAMVLLHQTIVDHEWSTRLHVNGSCIRLGTVAEVVDKVNGRGKFGIGIQDDQCAAEWTFTHTHNKDSMSAVVDSITVNGTVHSQPNRLRFLFPEPHETTQDLAERLLSLTYLTAERVGPRDVYDLQDPSSTQVVGARGENAVGLLFQRRDSDVLETLQLDTEPPALLRQVEGRMRMFFPGISLDVQQVARTSMVTLGVRTSDSTDYHRPVNVGFGITQVLPTIVAALAAKEGDLLLIENPEVHLHPAGQAMMGMFLAEVAAARVQVIVESHSDHILNGIRRSIKRQAISADAAAIHFFRSRDNCGEQVTSLALDSSGNIDDWPSGFFDQFDKDQNYFAGWGE